MEVIEEGKFKFYNKEKLEKFQKRGGDWILPECNWIGHFPEKKDETWENYKDMEPEKEVENGGETGDDEEEKDKLECNDCGYEWVPRSKNPSQCPKCGSRKWDD